jgi:hypothetical protein
MLQLLGNEEKERQDMQQSLTNIRTFFVYCAERDTILRSIKTALVIGTILAIINHGQQMLSGHFELNWIVPMLITYLVPFSVATYGQVQGKRQRDKQQLLAKVP